MWLGFIWLEIRTFNKMRGISWPAEELSTLEEGLSFIVLISLYTNYHSEAMKNKISTGKFLKPAVLLQLQLCGLSTKSTSVLRSTLLWDFRLHGLAVCYRLLRWDTQVVSKCKYQTANHCQSMLCKILKEQRSHSHHGGSPKSHKILLS